MQGCSNGMIGGRRFAGSARKTLRLAAVGRATLRLAAALAFSSAAPVPAAPPTVAVDVGHTLAASGARSARGRSEFEFNRDLALRVLTALDRLGLNTRVVNLDGQIGSLAARPAHVPDADFFLSIHHDSVGESELQFWEWDGQTESYSDRWAGHSLFVSRRNPHPERSVLCATAIGARLQRAGFEPTHKNGRRRDYADLRHAVHYYDDLVVLYRALQPAVLFEAGVIKHRDEELLLRDPRRQTLMAGEIATGIAACMMAGR